MGTLYSRNVATLTAKGEYIFALDNDDLFLVEDLFYLIYNIASQDDFDIVGFKSITAPSYNPKIKIIKDDGFFNHPHNLIVNQPKLGLFTISRNNAFHYNDVYVWGKTIKTDIYKKAVNSMGKERYSTFVTWAEDTCMTFIIYNIAKSLKFVRKYGIFHIKASSCATFTQSSDIKTFGEIFLTDIIFDFSKNNSDKNYAAYQALDSSKRDFFNVRYSERNSILLKDIINKILSCKFISEENKNKVKNYFDNIKYFNQTEKDEYMKQFTKNKDVNNINNI
jgi:hypothetical protein